MIFLIGGESHTGKTLLAQKLLELTHYPYMSLDHLKMGFIRGFSPPPFSVSDDEAITAHLWGIVEGIIRTCLENRQNLIVEGVYLSPKNVKALLQSMPDSPIRALFLLFSKEYILGHFEQILLYENAIEKRMQSFTNEQNSTESTLINTLIQEHTALKAKCVQHGMDFVEIRRDYNQEIQRAIDYFKVASVGG